MHLTPQELLDLRNIVIRAVNECHELLSAAARSAQSERCRHEGRGRPGKDRPAGGAGESGITPGGPAAPPVLKLAYTVPEVAVALGISKTTVWRYRFDGRLEAFKLGGRTLIMAETLHAFIAAASHVAA